MTHPQRRTGPGSPDPVLITDAAQSYEDELRVRKRRYAIMMGMRIPCMILAAVFYETPWIAVTLLILSIPLPWMAVLIANDRLPIKREDAHRYRSDRNALEARPHQVIDSPRSATDRPVGDGPVVDGPVVDGEVLDRSALDGPDLTHGATRGDARRAG